MFEEQCRLILRGLGFTTSEKGRVVDCLGIEVNAEITNAQGDKYWVECTGSWLSKRAGLLRTDSVKKVVNSALLNLAAGVTHSCEHPPFLILTSHMPKKSTRGDMMLEVAMSSGAVLDVICVNDPEDMQRLASLAGPQDV